MESAISSGIKFWILSHALDWHYHHIHLSTRCCQSRVSYVLFVLQKSHMERYKRQGGREFTRCAAEGLSIADTWWWKQETTCAGQDIEHHSLEIKSSKCFVRLLNKYERERLRNSKAFSGKLTTNHPFSVAMQANQHRSPTTAITLASSNNNNDDNICETLVSLIVINC